MLDNVKTLVLKTSRQGCAVYAVSEHFQRGLAPNSELNAIEQPSIFIQKGLQKHSKHGVIFERDL